MVSPMGKPINLVDIQSDAVIACLELFREVNLWELNQLPEETRLFVLKCYFIGQKAQEHIEETVYMEGD